MKRYTIFALFVVAIPLIAFADGVAKSIVVNPPNSGFTLISESEAVTYEARFSGKAWVSGTFRAEWHPNYSDRKPGYILALAIKPDKADAERLPYVGDHKIELIWIENKKGLVQRVFAKEMASRLLNRQVQIADVHGRFLIEDYHIGECGSP